MSSETTRSLWRVNLTSQICIKSFFWRISRQHQHHSFKKHQQWCSVCSVPPPDRWWSTHVPSPGHCWAWLQTLQSWWSAKKKKHQMRFDRMSEAIFLITAGLWLYWYYINGTSHHGASVQGLLHDGEQVVWRFLGFIQFPDTAGKILHGLERAATFQGLVAAV